MCIRRRIIEYSRGNNLHCFCRLYRLQKETGEGRGACGGHSNAGRRGTPAAVNRQKSVWILYFVPETSCRQSASLIN